MIQIAQRIGTSEHYEIGERLGAASFRLVLYTTVLPPGLWGFPETRTGGWSLDLYDGQGAPLVLGLGVRPKVEMLYPYRHLAVPPGELVCWTSDGLDPDLTAFAEDRARLLYKAPVPS